MRKLFNKIPLHLKLLFSAVIPLLALFYYFYIIQAEKQIRITSTDNFITRLNSTIATNNLIDELQQERRFSLSFILKRENNSNINGQRERSDIAFSELEKLSNDGFTDDYKKFTFIDELGEWRRRVDSDSITANEILSNYQLLIDRLQGIVNIRTDNPLLIQRSNNKLEASAALSEMTNLIALMRLEIYLKLINNPSITPSLLDFQKNYALFKSYEYELLTNGDKEIVNNYNKLRESSVLNPTLNFFDTITETNEIENPIDAEEWWRTSAAGMDALKNMHQGILTNIQTDTLQMYQDNIQEQRTLLIALILIALLISIIIFFAIKSTTEQINKLKKEAYRIALGETGIDLPPYPNDALGRLAQSFIQIDKNNIKIAKAAEEIGKNNFNTEFNARGEKDKLGQSILKMNESLKSFSASKENEIWIQTGLSTINSVLIGRKNLEETCSAVLASLVNYLNADIGTLYLHNYTDTLELQCSYAAINNNLIPKVIRLGQNRLGTAAKNMKPIIIDHVPEDYLAIGSSMGKSQPTHLFLIPLVQNGQVEGIMEIASFVSFHNASVDFIKQVAVNIASTFQSMKSRVRLQELLEETQTQTEELQTQHSELENLNTELEAQTQKLQASEEELKVQQEELLQANQELEERSNLLEDRNHLIIERNLEIQKKAEELELSTRYKSEFLANMSHELRTPLNSILLLSRLLSENGTNNLSPDQVEYAEVIQTSGKGLLSLIDEILDLSKIEAGKMSVEFKLEKIDEIVLRMRSLFGEMAKEKQLDLQFSVSGSTPRSITTDRSRLEQILKNLLSNALKFTAKGYIQLRIEPNTADPDFIDVIVKDTGIGIAPEKQEHIFGAFQQADGSTRRKYGGTGLGLAISRELARLLGGTLTLKSKVGTGSEFTLTIPIDINKLSQNRKSGITAVPDVKPVDTIIREEIDEGEGEQTYIASVIPEEIPDDRDKIKKGDNVILIIEDDPSFAKSLLSFTRKKGYKGLVAVRGDYGVELAFKYNPQAILLDLQLPIKDGWQVMSELKENPSTRHIPVHMMSSYEIKKESLRKGAIDFINKPVAFEQMNEIFIKLEKALSKGPKKVLIIEENPKHAQALSQYLDSFNVKAEIKENIQDGVSALQGDKIDCVILDMGIPDEEGYKTLETIKDNPGLENLPIIIFTGKNLSRIEEQKIKQYADSIVVKTAHSYQRILDEVTLFLHLIEENKVAEGKTKPSRKTGRFNEILEGKTVLIADDDIRNIFSLTKALESNNMKVLSANDGKEALEILEAHQDEVDIILMDMMMPELDGYETTTRIRKNPKMANLPILAVTAKAMIGDREKCIRAGASDYISKPVDIDQLISLLRVWLYN
ncbi:response regulator [Albibacterium bauzanense]|uniref:histidine kinase n=1 Tax=Albibacterium bauzanense TaxID=653929 RepID=A0A4R1LTQ6_9SPHI|nr:response regulator [Albibacterium bauzanense]TCK82708.1 signal transduction histidine kinase [Albibacterium bauzanense]